MTSQRVERTWIRTGGYGRFRGEWVKVTATSQFKFQDVWVSEVKDSYVPSFGEAFLYYSFVVIRISVPHVYDKNPPWGWGRRHYREVLPRS